MKFDDRNASIGGNLLIKSIHQKGSAATVESRLLLPNDQIALHGGT